MKSRKGTFPGSRQIRGPLGVAAPGQAGRPLLWDEGTAWGCGVGNVA